MRVAAFSGDLGHIGPVAGKIRRRQHETHFSAQQPRPQAPSRIPCTHGHQSRTHHHQPPPRPGPEAPVGLSPRAVPEALTRPAGDLTMRQMFASPSMSGGAGFLRLWCGELRGFAMFPHSAAIPPDGNAGPRRHPRQANFTRPKRTPHFPMPGRVSGKGTATIPGVSARRAMPDFPPGRASATTASAHFLRGFARNALSNRAGALPKSGMTRRASGQGRGWRTVHSIATWDRLAD